MSLRYPFVSNHLRPRPFTVTAASTALWIAASLSPRSAAAADILVVANTGADFVAADFGVNTSHTLTSWDADVTPTLDELLAYDAVLLFENGVFANAGNVGDVLAEYVLAGGGVVLGTFYWQNRSDASFGGTWGALESYDPLTAQAGACEYSGDDVDPLSIVDHPITAGVTQLHANSFRGGTTAKPEAEVLALWSGTNNLGLPDPAVAVRYEGEACVIGISIFPDASFNDFTGDFYVLFDNALAFAADCAPPGPCGNGVLDEGEGCDDGNYATNDACVHCQPATCGDGYVQLGVEPCDDGDLDNDDSCLVGCIAPTCGDGFVNIGVEPCDDSNTDNTDDCIDTCQPASCGDGYLHAGVETCDDGNGDNGDDCPLSCEPATCGDGYVQVGVEPCDDGNADNADDCLVGCIAPICGDGFVQAGVEACDDGNTDDTDICVGTMCQLAACGDGFLHTGIEDCDDGNDVDDDGCTNCNVDAAAESSSGGGEGSTGGESGSTGAAGSSEGGATSGGVDGSGDSTTSDTVSATDTAESSGDATVGAVDSSGGGDSSGGASAGGTDDDGGCACRVEDRSAPGAAAPWLALGLGALVRRRRRR